MSDKSNNGAIGYPEFKALSDKINASVMKLAMKVQLLEKEVKAVFPRISICELNMKTVQAQIETSEAKVIKCEQAVQSFKEFQKLVKAEDTAKLPLTLKTKKQPSFEVNPDVMDMT